MQAHDTMLTGLASLMDGNADEGLSALEEAYVASGDQSCA